MAEQKSILCKIHIMVRIGENLSFQLSLLFMKQYSICGKFICPLRSCAAARQWDSLQTKLFSDLNWMQCIEEANLCTYREREVQLQSNWRMKELLEGNTRLKTKYAINFHGYLVEQWHKYSMEKIMQPSYYGSRAKIESICLLKWHICHSIPTLFRNGIIYTMI